MSCLSRSGENHAKAISALASVPSSSEGLVRYICSRSPEELAAFGALLATAGDRLENIEQDILEYRENQGGASGLEDPDIDDDLAENGSHVQPSFGRVDPTKQSRVRRNFKRNFKLAVIRNDFNERGIACDRRGVPGVFPSEEDLRVQCATVLMVINAKGESQLECNPSMHPFYKGDTREGAGRWRALKDLAAERNWDETNPSLLQMNIDLMRQHLGMTGVQAPVSEIGGDTSKNLAYISVLSTSQHYTVQKFCLHLLVLLKMLTLESAMFVVYIW